MARVMTSGSLSRAGRPLFGGCEVCSSFHQSSTRTYNETKKESRSSMAPSFGESLVHQHLRMSLVTTAAMLAICLLALVETTNTAEATSLPENGKIVFTRASRGIPNI